MSSLELPAEIVRRMVDLLEPKEKVNVSEICKRFYQACHGSVAIDVKIRDQDSIDRYFSNLNKTYEQVRLTSAMDRALFHL